MLLDDRPQSINSLAHLRPRAIGEDDRPRWLSCGHWRYPSARLDTPLVVAHVRQSAAMPEASNPKSASSSPRSPCSMYLPGIPSRRMWLVFNPASAAASSKAEPN